MRNFIDHLFQRRSLKTGILIILLSSTSANAQSGLPDLGRPMEIPIILSGNFGELRNNHFHSGLDMKTQGRTGIPIHSVEDGYVSRIVVSPWGFGRAIYITHPDIGLTTVYGHLDSFSKEIDKAVRDRQYELERFNVDLNFMPGELPVKRGQLIALSGNAGSSGGPHLHIDVRDTKTEEALDPMPYFKKYINDKVAPQVRSLALYCVEGEGVLSGTNQKSASRAGENLKKPFSAWGKVVPAIKAYDKMSGTTNIYGVKYLSLKVDGKDVYRRTIDKFDFADTRAVNTLVDYSGVVNSGSWTMWTRQPESRPLQEMIKSVDNGIINIDEEREYSCEWILEDEHGNVARQPFKIIGKQTDIPEKPQKGNLFSYQGRNTYSDENIKVTFPEETFYDDVYFTIKSVDMPGYISPAYDIADRAIPISGEYTVEIRLPNDTVADKSKYCLVRINGKRRSAVDSEYVDGTIVGTPSALGRFAVTTDTTAPTIRPEKPQLWSKNGRVSFIIADNLSGIKTYRGEIDGKFALFELDGKSGRLSYKMDSSRFQKGKSHTVKVYVTDACGNSSNYSGKFHW